MGKRARTEKVETAESPKFEYVVIYGTEGGDPFAYGIMGPLSDMQKKYLMEGVDKCPDDPEGKRLLVMTGQHYLNNLDESDKVYNGAKEGDSERIPDSQMVRIGPTNWPKYPVMVVLCSDWC